MANVNDIVKAYSMAEFSDIVVYSVENETLEAYTVYKSNYKDRLDWYFGHTSIKIPAEVLKREVHEFQVYYDWKNPIETPKLFIETYEYPNDNRYMVGIEAE